MYRFIVGTLLMGALVTTQVQAASFDCAKASTVVERTICADSELGALDERYAAAYTRALKSAPDPRSFRKEASAWLKRVRNVCPDAECIGSAYLARIEALEQQKATVASSFSMPSFNMSGPSKADKDQLLKLGGWVIFGTIVALVVLGLTNRVVIFYNTADAWWSISPCIFWVGSMIIAGSVAPEGRALPRTPIEEAILYCGYIGALFGVYTTFHNAIIYNRNIFLGLLVGGCKLIVSILMAITFIGAFRNMFDSKATERQVALSAMIVMVVGFLWVALVNGERVYERKGWELPEE